MFSALHPTPDIRCTFRSRSSGQNPVFRGWVFRRPLHELVVRLEILVVLNLRVQAIDLTDMSRGVLVACGTGFAQRDFDERAPEQNRGQRIFSFDG